jgi:hypothetical protein
MYVTTISGVSFDIDCIPKMLPSACHASYYWWHQEAAVDVRQIVKRALLAYRSVILNRHELFRAMRG